MSNISSGGDGG
jgi:hypothetical protein